jgi:hypothetical protein
MATTLQNGAETLTLPDMLWEDEFNWQPVQGTVSYGGAGALHIQRAVKQAGRPMTLGGPFLTLAQVQTLYAWSTSATAQLQLTLRGQAYAVVFTPNGTALEARPVFDQATYDAADPYRARIRFITTA